jgi:predicted DNA-binding antitoxin AbrB/MazE fold protein
LTFAGGYVDWSDRTYSGVQSMSFIHAIYENGVFRPVGRVDLPESCEVEFEPRLVRPEAAQRGLDELYAVLAERFPSDEPDVAARHDEHQP